MTQITAHNLLQAFLDLHGLAPDLLDWTEEKLAYNPPRLIRLKRLKAMFLAFGMEWDPVAFTEGKCVDTVLAVDSIKNQAKAELGVPELDVGAHHLRFFFGVLYRHRKCVAAVLRSGMDEAGGLFLLACKKIFDVQEAIQAKITPIDDLLIEMIDTLKRAFTTDQLIRDYGYPSDDLHQIDCDWY
jgi:hypothetical protein